MLLPTKHINFAESIIGLGSYVLNSLSKPKTVDELWEQYNKDFNAGVYTAKSSFDKLILAVVFLYSIDAIKEKDGVLGK